MWPFKKKDIEEPEIVGNRAVAATDCEHPIQARVSSVFRGGWDAQGNPDALLTMRGATDGSGGRRGLSKALGRRPGGLSRPPRGPTKYFT